MDATTPNQARRIAACAEAACELEVPTCNEVGPKEKNSIYVLCTLLLMLMMILMNQNNNALTCN